MEEQPEQQVGKLAEAAPRGGGQLAVYHNEPVPVGDLPVCLPHRLEEGEGLPRADKKPVQLLGRQLEIKDLVLLVEHGKAGLPVVKGNCLPKDHQGQGPGKGTGVAATIQAHPQVEAGLSLGLAQGEQGGESFCQSFSGHGRVLLFGGPEKDVPLWYYQFTKRGRPLFLIFLGSF